MMNRNLSFETLLDWVEGRLDEAQAGQTAEAASQDEAAQEILDWVRLFEQVSDEFVLVEPPASVHDDLEQLFPATPEPEKVVHQPLPA